MSESFDNGLNHNEKYVIDHYDHMTYNEMGKELGLTRGSIQYIMNKHNLKKKRYSVQDYRYRVGQLEDFLEDWQSQFDSIENLSKDDIINLVERFNVQSQTILEE